MQCCCRLHHHKIHFWTSQCNKFVVMLEGNCFWLALLDFLLLFLGTCRSGFQNLEFSAMHSNIYTIYPQLQRFLFIFTCFLSQDSNWHEFKRKKILASKNWKNCIRLNVKSIGQNLSKYYICKHFAKLKSECLFNQKLFILLYFWKIQKIDKKAQKHRWQPIFPFSCEKSDIKFTIAS